MKKSLVATRWQQFTSVTTIEIREFGNLDSIERHNDNGKNIIAYIVVFEPKYTLRHLICLFKYSCFSQTALIKVKIARQFK
jgi:hypothetical protein